jgi:CDP-diacylglycerol--glycerol-3-phosphate 3-phosphatidyltransferase
VIIIGREFTVLGLRTIASAEGLTIKASALGKVKMSLQIIAVSAVILGAKQELEFLKPYATVLMWLVVISAILSALQYFLKFWSQVDSSIKQRRRLRLLERREKTQDVPTL